MVIKDGWGWRKMDPGFKRGQNGHFWLTLTLIIAAGLIALWVF